MHLKVQTISVDNTKNENFSNDKAKVKPKRRKRFYPLKLVASDTYNCKVNV